MNTGENVLKRVRIFWICLLIAALGACASPSTIPPGKGASPGMAIVPVEKPGLFSKPSNDAAVLNEGASYLGFPEKPADYAKARASFETLIKNYPKSKWRPLAETLIRLLDDIKSVQDRGQSEQEQLKNENERLKKEIQVLNGRFQAERSALPALLQENEQLKKDIELLKKLEVQLDKREKMLR
jgi:hypothetical protein